MAAAAQSGTGSSLQLWTFLSELLLACRCCCCCLLLPLAEDLPPPPSQLPFTSFRLGRGLTAGSGLWCVAEGPQPGSLGSSAVFATRQVYTVDCREVAKSLPCRCGGRGGGRPGASQPAREEAPLAVSFAASRPGALPQPAPPPRKESFQGLRPH